MMVFVREITLRRFLTVGATPFTIGRQTGDVYLKTNLDHEDNSDHQVEVVVTDSGTPPRSGTVTVAVTVNDADDEDHAECDCYYFHRTIQEGTLTAPAEVRSTSTYRHALFIYYVHSVKN